MKRMEDFTFIDENEINWTAPADTVIDGVSIPQFLWSFLSGPFEGNDRKASVVHDYYCDAKNRPWQNVHRMFYEACLVEGLNEFQAKVMYAGVYAGGPRWTIGLGTPSDKSTISSEDNDHAFVKKYEYKLNNKQWIENEDPSLVEIEDDIDAQIPV